MATAVTVGARKVLLSDVVLVAVQGARVDLDPATLQRCDADAEKCRGKSMKAVESSALAGPSVDERHALDEPDARAALFARVVALMQARAGVRGTAVSLLAALLNARVTPLLPGGARAATAEGTAVAAALLGRGSAFYGGTVCLLAPAMAAAGLLPLDSLLPRELQSLRLGSYAARGRAAAVAAGAANALSAATAAAALSCEAARAFTEPFEAVHFDICRQHRGQMVAAEGLRLLLNGSQLVNTRGGGSGGSGGVKAGGSGKGGGKGGGGEDTASAASAAAARAGPGQDGDAIRAIPQYHGPARDAVMAAAAALEAELNSAEAGPLDRAAATAGPFHPQQVCTAATSLNHAIGLLAAGSMQRTAILEEATAAADVSPATSDGTSPSHPAERGSAAFSRSPSTAAADAGSSGNGYGGGYEPADFDGLCEELSMLSIDEMTSSLSSALRTLEQALAAEAAAALAAFHAEDRRAAAAAQAGVDAKAAARAGKGGGPPPPPPPPSDAVAADGAPAAVLPAAPALTAEQLAKVEEKRKAKAEKASAKAAKKAGGGSGGKGAARGVVLGAGTAEVRAWLLARVSAAASAGPTAAAAAASEAAAAAAGETTAVEAAAAVAAPTPSAEVLAAAVDLFACGEDGFGPAVAALLERLGSGGQQRKPKIPKGTRDFGPEQMRVRERAFNAIRRVFKRHGAVEIDTPVFELKETLTGKYGEDQKLIYDLADQGGELLALRYDLTVPFARYLALNSTGNIKRYHIAKVYRRDQPNMQRGRFREFYQCDFDVAGAYGTMVADAEVVSVACEILAALPIGSFEVKLNHRRLLDAVLDLCGCPPEKVRSICSAVDKLDKLPWADVRCEMVEEKGLPAAVADAIGGFVTFRGEPRALWRQLTAERKFGDHAEAAAAMAELKLLFDYLEAMGTLRYVSFDLSLARGLHYYTGLIYECVVTDGESKVGSIAAGGRYDGLVGMFSAGGQQVPCVGVSIGIERVLTLMETQLAAEGAATPSPVQVFVASIGAGLLPHRMQVARSLWSADISAEFAHQENPKLKRQLDEVLERRIPFMVIVGEDEAARGVVKLKDMACREEEEVAMDAVPAALLARGCPTVGAEGTAGAAAATVTVAPGVANTAASAVAPADGSA